jgi:VCBS repeat protein
MFSLLAAFALQSGSGFGWDLPIWEREFTQASHGLMYETADFSGDGIQEVIVLSTSEHYSLEIFNGADGKLWYRLPPPGGDPHSYHWIEQDLDGDGLPEFILGNPYSNGGFGQIQVVHGGDGQLIWEAWGRIQDDRLGATLLLADLDGDGLKDIFSGSELNGRVRAFSGKTGQSLWSQSGLARRFSALTPDLNGDGIADIFLGGASRFSLLSGANGQAIWNVSTSLLSFSLTWEIKFSDVNQDGVPDLWVISPFENQPPGIGFGAVEVVDGLTGAHIWSAIGAFNDNQLGFRAMLQDMNGDGVEDLLSRSASYPCLLDGRTGDLIWARSFSPGRIVSEGLTAEDFNGDGLLDLLVLDRFNSGGAANRLEVISGQDGTTVWSVDSQWTEEYFNSLTLADFDLDGVSDILASSPSANSPLSSGGLMRLISGATGKDLWQLTGVASGSELGRYFVLLEIDNQPGPDVIAIDNSYGSERGRSAFAGLSGVEMWQIPADPEELRTRSVQAFDINGDGHLDLLEHQWDWSNWDTSTFRAFDGPSGSVVWTLEFDPGTAAEVIFSQPDLDQDGVEELVLKVAHGNGSKSLRTYSGGGQWWTSGLQVSQPSLSAANGGSIQLEVNFPAKQAGWAYQLLLSETGNQITSINGFEVPLSMGFWLSSTYLGSYPVSMFSQQLGILSDDGQTRITLETLPNQISPAFIGTSMYLAVISAEPGSPWSFSSGSAAVQILP